MDKDNWLNKRDAGVTVVREEVDKGVEISDEITVKISIDEYVGLITGAALLGTVRRLVRSCTSEGISLRLLVAVLGIDEEEV